MDLGIVAVASAVALVAAPELALDWGVTSQSRYGQLRRPGQDDAAGFVDLRLSPALQASIASGATAARARYVPSLMRRYSGVGGQSAADGDDSRRLWLNRGELHAGVGEGHRQSLTLDGWVAHGQVHRTVAQAGADGAVDGESPGGSQAWSGEPRSPVLDYQDAGARAALDTRLRPDLAAGLSASYDWMDHSSDVPDDGASGQSYDRAYRLRRQLWEAEGSLTSTGRRTSLTLATSFTRVSFGGPETYHGVLPSLAVSGAATRRLMLSLRGGVMALWEVSSPPSPDSPPRTIAVAGASASGVLYRTHGQSLTGAVEAGVGPTLDAVRGEPDTRAHLTLRLAYQPTRNLSAGLSGSLLSAVDLVDGRLQSAAPAANGYDTDDYVGTLTAQLGYRLSPSTTLSGGLQGHGRWDAPLVRRAGIPYREVAVFVALVVETGVGATTSRAGRGDAGTAEQSGRPQADPEARRPLSR